MNEYNPFTHVFTNIIEPLEKLDNPFRQEFTFNIYQRALDVVILPKYSEYELELSLVNLNNENPALNLDDPNATPAVVATSTKMSPDNLILYTIFKKSSGLV